MLSREISVNCLPNPSTRDIQQELKGVHLQPYSVIQPSLSAPSPHLQGEMYKFARKISPYSSSWTGRVGRRDKVLRLCHEELKQAKILILSSKHSWMLLILSALWSKPSPSISGSIFQPGPSRAKYRQPEGKCGWRYSCRQLLCVKGGPRSAAAVDSLGAPIQHT